MWWWKVRRVSLKIEKIEKIENMGFENGRGWERERQTSS